ncbi:chemotaxis protein CheX [Humisphaera borealis]|uniref:Chemotaxis protein CheX n=1 Tax=Humisphaera borealis TaxID=2807512 RepID=A0A7M2WZW7_9BACT|nr:chemotaxis protein CheX [Humisphaera borealis]QOV91036.1 chemotaxis protein CheX [Humisphaera borealis]
MNVITAKRETPAGPSATKVCGQRLSLTLPFVDAIAQLFEKMLGCPVEVSELSATTSRSAPTDICGRIDFSGEYRGNMCLRLEPAAAHAMGKAFTGMTFDLHSAEMADTVGELSNMIAGAAKAKLGIRTRISVPKVWIGVEIDPPAPVGAVIPCRVGDASFSVEITLVQQQAA